MKIIAKVILITALTTSILLGKDMNLQELSKYNGKDGNKGYVAVDGTIYNVTKSSAWANGMHKGKLKAGTDVSEYIDNSPHGRKVLKKLPVVGKLTN